MARINVPSARVAGMQLGVKVLSLWLFLLVRQALAYIPATPTNDSAAVQAGVNQSDTSMLSLQWYPNASAIHSHCNLREGD